MKTMKKTLNMMLAMMAGAMAFTACSSDDILENIENNEVAEAPSQLKPMTFSAVQEGQGGTRAAIATDTDGKANGINWTAGDKISIFDGASENAGVQMFELATGENTTSATFTGSAADAVTYYALYPYAVGETSRAVTQAEAAAAAGSYSDMLDMWKHDYEQMGEDGLRHFPDECEMFGISAENQAIILAFLKNQPIGTPGVMLDGSSIKNVVIPAEQTATAGSADPTAMVMVAKGDDTNTLQFKNVCAYVKVTPQFDCTAICLKSNGTENIAGKVTVDCSGETPSSTITADGTNSVMLTGTITAGNAYYIAVLPVELTSGFTIEFLTADKTNYYARSTNNTLALARSNVKNLGEFATTGTWTYNIPTHSDDGNGHSWRLITPGFKIATSYASNDGVTFANIPSLSWGANWVLPAADEMTDLISKGYIVFDKTDPMHSKIRLVGAGVLKYAGDDYIDNGSYGLYLWSSTPGENDDRQTIIMYNGTSTNVNVR